jgi:hypothetical protein
MSYSVTIHGHSDLDTPDEVQAFELDVIDRVTKFAATLPGCGGGTVNTTTQAQAVLPASDGAEPTNADGSPIEKDEGRKSNRK